MLILRCLLKVRMWTSEDMWSPHRIVCYGLDEIARAGRVVTPRQLQKFFPEVKAEELIRPEKIELLISHREGRLAPQRMKRVGDLVLWDGPLGKTVGGAHSDLFEEVEVTIQNSRTHFARSMRTRAVMVEEFSRGPEHEGSEEIRSTATSSREVPEWLSGKCQPGGKKCP